MNVTLPETDRGQVGIGTLIVFIAMVLVAAIAAGVLINTAGFLQTQAEDTGTESTEQVANNLNVINSVGEVVAAGGPGDEDQISQVRVTVQPAAGADDINLEEVTIQYVSDNDFANLVHYDQDNSAANSFVTPAVTAEDESDNVMTDNADRYDIVIDLAADADIAGTSTNSDTADASSLVEGEEAELTLTTETGAQVVSTLQVPDSLAGDSGGDTVKL